LVVKEKIGVSRKKSEKKQKAQADPRKEKAAKIIDSRFPQEKEQSCTLERGAGRGKRRVIKKTFLYRKALLVFFRP